jgi:hypothetical protein
LPQFIESVETENCVDDLSQARQKQKQQDLMVANVTVKTIIQQQPQSPQLQLLLQQIHSSDNPIKMVDIIKHQPHFARTVISEIEVQNIKQDADYQFGGYTLDLKQMISNSVNTVDTFRRGTELLYNPNPMIVLESDDKTMSLERRQQSNFSASIKTA